MEFLTHGKFLPGMMIHKGGNLHPTSTIAWQRFLRASQKYFKFIWKRKTRVRAAVTMFGVQAVSKYCFPSAGSLSHFVISHGWYSSIHFIHLDRKGPSELSRLSNILRDLGAASWDVGIFSLKNITRLKKIAVSHQAAPETPRMLSQEHGTMTG